MTTIKLAGLQKESSLQEPAYIMHIQIHVWAYVDFLMKIAGVNIITLYDTGANMS